MTDTVCGLLIADANRAIDVFVFGATGVAVRSLRGVQLYGLFQLLELFLFHS